MELYRAFVELVAKRALGVTIGDWQWINSANNFSMCCGPMKGSSGKSISYHVNVRALGLSWFDRFAISRADMVDLTIHKLGHYDGDPHLTDQILRQPDQNRRKAGSSDHGRFRRIQQVR